MTAVGIAVPGREDDGLWGFGAGSGKRQAQSAPSHVRPSLDTYGRGEPARAPLGRSAGVGGSDRGSESPNLAALLATREGKTPGAAARGGPGGRECASSAGPKPEADSVALGSGWGGANTHQPRTSASWSGSSGPWRRPRPAALAAVATRARSAAAPLGLFRHVPAKLGRLWRARPRLRRAVPPGSRPGSRTPAPSARPPARGHLLGPAAAQPRAPSPAPPRLLPLAAPSAPRPPARLPRRLRLAQSEPPPRAGRRVLSGSPLRSPALPGCAAARRGGGGGGAGESLWLPPDAQ